MAAGSSANATDARRVPLFLPSPLLFLPATARWAPHLHPRSAADAAPARMRGVGVVRALMVRGCAPPPPSVHLRCVSQRKKKRFPSLSHTKTQHSRPAAGASSGRLTTHDALSYLREVKQRFANDKRVYDTFLNIMKEFKAQQ